MMFSAGSATGCQLFPVCGWLAFLMVASLIIPGFRVLSALEESFSFLSTGFLQVTEYPHEIAV